MPGRYPTQFRRKVLDLLKAGRSVTAIAGDLGLSTETVYNWRNRELIDIGQKPGLSRLENELWQTDMTAIWCGEDGWAYLVLVTDCFCRSILGWSFSLRCRARDFSPALEMAWSTAFPYGVDKTEIAELVVRHDNGTQFTSRHYREVADVLGVKLLRTRYRHPDGNALVERIFLSLKTEEVWPSDYETFSRARDAVTAWIDNYNRERPHQALGYRTPSEVRAAAPTSTQSGA